MQVKVVLNRDAEYIDGDDLIATVQYKEEYYDALLKIKDGDNVIAVFLKWDYYLVSP